MGASILCVLVAIASLQPAANGQPTAQSPTDNNDLCGYSQRYAMAKCNDKLRCDADCQRETCRALVGFHGSLSSKIAHDEDSSGAEKWLTDPEQCDSLASFGYCSWLGVECCCLKNVSRVPLCAVWRLWLKYWNCRTCN